MLNLSSYATIFVLLGFIVMTILIMIFSKFTPCNQIVKTPSAKKFPFEVYIINLDRKPERYGYVATQLDKIGINNYKKWVAVDGLIVGKDFYKKLGFSDKLSERKGEAGCAASHITLWKHLVDVDSDWVLILEDDAHFHPRFVDLFFPYWHKVPKDAKMVFLGHCCALKSFNTGKLVLKKAVSCLHAYMINGKTAKYMLDNLLMKSAIDIDIYVHFMMKGTGSYVFNGNVMINGICPNDYKKQNKDKCLFEGIVYQNRDDYGSDIR